MGHKIIYQSRELNADLVLNIFMFALSVLSAEFWRNYFLIFSELLRKKIWQTMGALFVGVGSLSSKFNNMSCGKPS